METINLWEISNKIHIKPEEKFLEEINFLIHNKFKSKEKFYLKLYNSQIRYTTFRNILKYSYFQKGYFAPLNTFLKICNKLNIPKKRLQNNITSYKTVKGYNIIENPKLPIKITPIFDMLLAHNIADGTVINSKRNRQFYFGYRQFNKDFRLAYIKKLESIFGKIKFKENYFEESTRPYCPAVLSSLFFKLYNLNEKSFLSTTARIPDKILKKGKNYLLAVLLAFIIDEGNIDSTLICIKLKNIKLCEDLYKISKKLGFKCSFSSKGQYGTVNILRDGMKKLLEDYKVLIKEYPEATLYHMAEKLESSFKIYSRLIYKTRGNRELILKLLSTEDLSVNQLAQRISMTRQGVRFHIHNLEKEGKILRKSFIGEKNFLYGINNRRKSKMIIGLVRQA